LELASFLEERWDVTEDIEPYQVLGRLGGRPAFPTG
jgi:hypothetical protein